MNIQYKCFNRICVIQSYYLFTKDQPNNPCLLLSNPFFLNSSTCKSPRPMFIHVLWPIHVHVGKGTYFNNPQCKRGITKWEGR